MFFPFWYFGCFFWIDWGTDRVVDILTVETIADLKVNLVFLLLSFFLKIDILLPNRKLLHLGTGAHPKVMRHLKATTLCSAVCTLQWKIDLNAFLYFVWNPFLQI